MPVGGNPTRVSDVIVPEVFNGYVIERTAELSALVQSGIIVPNNELDALASSGGTVVNMPYWQDLDGEDEVLRDTPGWALTPDKIQAEVDKAHIIMRGKAWATSDLSKALSGDDPMAAIGNLAAEYWARRRQATLLAVLEGIYASGSMDSNLLDADQPMDGNVFVDAKFKMGDNHSKLTAVMMHSFVLANLTKNDLIETERDSEGRIIQTFMGHRVIVDDGLPVENGKYTSYLFGAGAIGYGDGAAPVPVEIDRHSLGGYDVLINRQHFLLHPRGVRFTSASVAAESPTNAELATGTNWERVYEPKNVRIVQVKTQESPAA
jgi:hypothetical protein